MTSQTIPRRFVSTSKIGVIRFYFREIPPDVCVVKNYINSSNFSERWHESTRNRLRYRLQYRTHTNSRGGLENLAKIGKLPRCPQCLLRLKMCCEEPCLRRLGDLPARHAARAHAVTSPLPTTPSDAGLLGSVFAQPKTVASPCAPSSGPASTRPLASPRTQRREAVASL